MAKKKWWEEGVPFEPSEQFAGGQVEVPKSFSQEPVEVKPQVPKEQAGVPYEPYEEFAGGQVEVPKAFEEELPVAKPEVKPEETAPPPKPEEWKAQQFTEIEKMASEEKIRLQETLPQEPYLTPGMLAEYKANIAAIDRWVGESKATVEAEVGKYTEALTMVEEVNQLQTQVVDLLKDYKFDEALPMLDKVVADYQKLGQEVPEDIQKLRDQVKHEARPLSTWETFQFGTGYEGKMYRAKGWGDFFAPFVEALHLGGEIWGAILWSTFGQKEGGLGGIVGPPTLTLPPMFTQDWHSFLEQYRQDAPGWLQTLAQWTNPIYFMPVGGLFAGLTSAARAIPLIGGTAARALTLAGRIPGEIMATAIKAPFIALKWTTRPIVKWTFEKFLPSWAANIWKEAVPAAEMEAMRGLTAEMELRAAQIASRIQEITTQLEGKGLLTGKATPIEAGKAIPQRELIQTSGTGLRTWRVTSTALGKQWIEEETAKGIIKRNIRTLPKSALEMKEELAELIAEQDIINSVGGATSYNETLWYVNQQIDAISNEILQRGKFQRIAGKPQFPGMTTRELQAHLKVYQEYAKDMGQALSKVLGIPEGVNPTLAVPKNEYFIATLMKNDIYRRAVNCRALRFGKPAFKLIYPLWFVEGKIKQALFLRQAIRQQGQNIKGVVVHRIEHTERLLKVNMETGLATVKPKAQYAKQLGDTIPAIEVIRHPVWFELSEPQLAAIREVHRLVREFKALLKAEGIEVKESAAFMEEGHEWFRLLFLGRETEKGFVAFPRTVPSRIAGKAGFERKALPWLSTEAVGKGFRPAPPSKSMSVWIDELYAKIADQRVINSLKPFGQTAKERLAQTNPELIDAFDTVRWNRENLKRTEVWIVHAARGEEIPGISIKAIEKQFPRIGVKLREAMAIGPEQFEKILSQLRKDMWQHLGTDPAAFRQRLAAIRGQTKLSITKANPLTKNELNKVLKELSHDDKLTADMLTQFYKEEYRFLIKVPVQERKRLLAELLPQVRAKLSLTEAEFVKVKADYSRALKQAIGLKIRADGSVERTIFGHPAFQNRIWPEEVYKDVTKAWGDQGMRWLGVVQKASGIMRTLVAVADFSAPFIQGLPLLGRDPVAWAMTTGRMLKAWRNKEFYEGYMMRVLDEPIKMFDGTVLKTNFDVACYLATHGVYFGGFEYFEFMPQISGALGRLPGPAGKYTPIALRQTYGRFERAFGFFGDGARLEWGKSLLRTIGSKEELMEVSNFLNVATGVMSSRGLGIGATQRQIEAAWLFFAPRYTRSGFMYFGAMLKGGIVGEEARKSLAGLLSTGMIYYVGTCLALGQEPELNPFSSKFMTIRIGKQRVGVGSFMTAFLRLQMNILGCAVGYGDKEPLDLVKLSKWDNPVIRFFWARTSPVTGTVVPLASKLIGSEEWGTNYLGEPFDTPVDYARFLGEKIVPISLQESMFEAGGTKWVSFLAEQAGMRSHPISAWERRDDLRELYAQADYGKSWWDLELDQKENLVQKYPDLKATTDEAFMRLANFTDATMKLFPEWGDQIQRINDKWSEDALNLQKQFEACSSTRAQTGTKCGELFRDGLKEINSNRAYALEMLQDDPRYELIYDWFEQRQDPEYSPPFDVAYNEYISIITSEELEDEFGAFQHDKYNELMDDFKGKWGEDVWSRVQEYSLRDREVPSAMREYWKAREMLKPYWEINEQKYEGLYPKDQDERDQWVLRRIQAENPFIAHIYQQLKALETTNPTLAKTMWNSSSGRMILRYINDIKESIPTINSIVTAERRLWRARHPEAEAYGALFYDWVEMAEEERQALLTDAATQLQALLPKTPEIEMP